MRPKRSLGQNFLRDDGIIQKIVGALDLDNNDTVVEIGSGQGALTGRLVGQAGSVIAIEFDRDLIGPLKTRFGSFANFRLVNADALSVDFSAVLAACDIGGQAKLIANLPYNISTPILRRLAEQRSLFSTLVLMFQKEVVERITAGPGGKERGFLSVITESAFETEYLFDVPPEAFSPVPRVRSSVVRLTPKEPFPGDERLFWQTVSAGFAQKRKTILNSLRPRFPDARDLLTSAGIDPMRRAETLSLDEWIELTRLSALMGQSLGTYRKIST